MTAAADTRAPPGAAEWADVSERVRETARRRSASERVLHPEVLRLAGRVRGKRTLDVACGHGALVRVLAQRGAVALGVDASAEQVREAQREAAEAALDPRPEFAVADLAAPATLPRGAFDLITALRALDAGRKPAAALGTLARLLRPGGRLVLALPHPNSLETPAERPLQVLFRSLRDTGLRVVDLIEPGDDDRTGRFLVLLCEPRRARRRGRKRTRAD